MRRLDLGKIKDVIDQVQQIVACAAEYLHIFILLGRPIGLRQQVCNPHDGVQIVMEMVSARSQEKGLVLSCEIAPDVPNMVIGDPTRLRQVIMNLLGNAIKFTASGTVALRVELDHHPL